MSHWVTTGSSHQRHGVSPRLTAHRCKSLGHHCMAAHSTAMTYRLDICVAFDDHYRSRADCESLSKRSNTCPAHSMTVCVHCAALPSVTCGVTVSMPLMACDWRPALHLSQANCTSLQVTGSPLAAHSTAMTCRFDIDVAFDDHYRSRADCESLSKRANTCPAHSMTVCVHCAALP